MKFTNGLFLDSSNTNQPSGTWKHLMNGTFDKDLGVITDEDGFRLFGKNLPDYSYIGGIAVDNNIIAFFTDSSNIHEIGIINENGYYDRIILATAFNFDEKYPIKCKLIKNYKGERIIIFIDDHNTPKIINIDDISYSLDVNREYSGTTINKFELFPDYKEAKIVSNSVTTYGDLLSGVYYVITQYENTSTNIKTSWSKQSAPFYINSNPSNFNKGGLSGVSSGKSLYFSVSGIDVSFDKINIGFVYEIDGVTYAKQYGTELITSSSISSYIISSNNGIDLTLEEILINPTKYIRIGDIEITDSEILGSNVIADEDINFQKYANMIEINYVPTYKTVTVNSSSMVELHNLGTTKGFRSGEVYAFYCSLVLKKGGESRLFHIAGRPPILDMTEVDSSGLAITQGFSSSFGKYQFENTADATGAITNMGYWENENEGYPNIDDFDSRLVTGSHTGANNAAILTDSTKAWTINEYIGYRLHNITDGSSGIISANTATTITVTLTGGVDNDFDINNQYSIGGLDLRGKNVRHHRFPDQRSLRSGGTSSFGGGELCTLGIVASNIIIPDHIADKVIGVKIYYAKRDIENMTCLGQSLLQYGHDNLYETPDILDKNLPYLGNFRSLASATPVKIPNINYLRFYDFALLKIKPAIQPHYISNQVNLKKEDLWEDEELYGECGQEEGGSDKDYKEVNINYTYNNNFTSSAVSDADHIRRIYDNKYVPSNVELQDSMNLMGDEHLMIHFSNSGLSIDTSALNINNAFKSTGTSGVDIFEEETCLIDLKKVLENVYYDFNADREVVCTSNYSSGLFLNVSGAGVKTTSTLYNGDNFITYNSIKRYTGNDDYLVIPVYDGTDPLASLNKGSFSHKYFIHESILNCQYRYDNAIKKNSYYPFKITNDNQFKQSFYKSVFDTYELFYSSDFNQLNDNDTTLIYDSESEYINNFPFRIIRSNVLNRDGKLNINFPPLQYYEISKKREEITGINYYNDKLTIRCENGTYITRPKQKIVTDAGDATLGSNDLFEIEPQELLSTDNGFIKSKSKFDTILIEHGLILLDSIEGKLFLLTDQIQELTSRESGLQNYFNNIFYYDNDSELITSFTSGIVIDAYDSSLRQKISISNYDGHISDFKIGDYIWLTFSESFCKILKIYSEVNYDSDDEYIVLETDYVGYTDPNQNIDYYRKHSSIYYDDGVIFGWNKKENTLYTTIKRLNDLPEIYKNRYIGHYYGTIAFINELQIGDVVKYQNDYRVWNGVDLDDALTLEDTSITLSFNFEIKKWVGFHSYIPDVYVYLKDNLLSFKDNLLYKHNQLNRKGQYYSDIRENFEISVVFNNGNAISKKYYGLNWIANFIDSSKILQNTITFETIQCSNEYEDLTEITLVPFVNLASIGNTRNIKGTWSYNALKNTGNKLLTDKYLLVKFTDSQSYSLYLYEISAQFRLLDKNENGN